MASASPARAMRMWCLGTDLVFCKFVLFWGLVLTLRRATAEVLKEEQYVEGSSGSVVRPPLCSVPHRLRGAVRIPRRPEAVRCLRRQGRARRIAVLDGRRNRTGRRPIDRHWTAGWSGRVDCKGGNGGRVFTRAR